MMPDQREGVVRTGQVVAEKPAVVTPFYALNLEGFSDGAYDYFQGIMRKHGPNSPGILYRYSNQAEGMDILKGAPEEIAAAAVFLASDEAAYVTGQTLHVNGGMAMI